MLVAGKSVSKIESMQKIVITFLIQFRLMMMLEEIKKVKINDIWLDAEKTKKTSDLLLKLKIGHIT